MVRYIFQISAFYVSIASLQAICVSIPEDRFNPANGADPEEMQHNASFHLGFYCLQRYSFRGFQYTKS